MNTRGNADPRVAINALEQAIESVRVGEWGEALGHIGVAADAVRDAEAVERESSRG